MKKARSKMIPWNHSRGMYLSKCFRIFHERDGFWWLCDIRGGTRNAPSWKFKTAKIARLSAETLIRIPFSR